MYEIQKEIPLPNRSGNTTERPNKYPFASMEIGDSFEVGPEDKTPSGAFRAQTAASLYSKKVKYSVQFATRKTEGNKLRVWRTK